MKIKFFRDTDTALLEFSESEVVETREINADVYVDFDRDGNLSEARQRFQVECSSAPGRLTHQ